MLKKIIVAAVFTIALLAAGCGRRGHDRGTVEHGVYRNAFFGFTMDIPAGMYVMPRAEIEKTVRSLGGDSDRTSETLLFISASDPATSHAQKVFNYNIAITSEKVPAGVTNNGQYAAETVRRFEKSAVADGGLTVGYTTLGGREFVKFELSANGIRQDIYARWHDGYVLVVTASYDGETQRDRIGEILSTITFR